MCGYRHTPKQTKKTSALMSHQYPDIFAISSASTKLQAARPWNTTSERESSQSTVDLPQNPVSASRPCEFGSRGEMVHTRARTPDLLVALVRHHATTTPPPLILKANNSGRSQVDRWSLKEFLTHLCACAPSTTNSTTSLLLGLGQSDLAPKHSDHMRYYHELNSRVLQRGCSTTCPLSGRPHWMISRDTKAAAAASPHCFLVPVSCGSRPSSTLHTRWQVERNDDLLRLGRIHDEGLAHKLCHHMEAIEVHHGSSAVLESTAACLAQLSSDRQAMDLAFEMQSSKLGALGDPTVLCNNNVTRSSCLEDLHGPDVVGWEYNKHGELDVRNINKLVEDRITDKFWEGESDKAPDKGLPWGKEETVEAAMPSQYGLQARDDQPMVVINTYEQVSLYAIYVSDAATLSVAFPMLNPYVFSFIISSIIAFPIVLGIYPFLRLFFPFHLICLARLVLCGLVVLRHESCFVISHQDGIVKTLPVAPPPPSRPDPQPYPTTPYQSTVSDLPASSPPPRPEPQPYPTSPYQSNLRYW